MRRELTNRVRYVLEDILPAAVRDSRWFALACRALLGERIVRLADARARAPFLTDSEYEALYRGQTRIHGETDNSEPCIQQVVSDLIGPRVCDVGCGTGALLKRMHLGRPEIQDFTGVDFVIDGAEAIDGVQYVAARIEALPFPDQAFDTVVCTHVVEHILDVRAAIAELRRITRRRLIIIVPREREFRFSLNLHFNFFPYAHSFLRVMLPIPEQHTCFEIGRDIYYREEIAPE